MRKKQKIYGTFINIHTFINSMAFGNMLSRVRVVLGLCFLAGISHVFSERIRYDNYPLYKVVPSDDTQLDVLKETQRYSDSLIYLQDLDMPKKDIGVVVAPHKVNDFVEMLKIKKIEHELVEENFQNILDEETTTTEQPTEAPAEEADEYYTWNQYNSYELTVQWMINISDQFPLYAQLIDGGVSYERRRILGLKLSNDKFKTDKPGIFLEGGMHGRDWISPATVTYIANSLLHATGSKLLKIAKKYNFYFIPHVNPDGYVYANTTDRLWSKTRSPQVGSCFGVDPDRNWNFHFDEVVTSKNPCDENYAGPEAFSEIETYSLSKYLEKMKGKIHLYVAFRAYSQSLLFPYGYTDEKAAHYNDLSKVVNVTLNELSKRYGTKYTGGSIYNSSKPISGSSIDWAYGKQGIKMAFSYKLRPNSNTYGYKLPADQIIPTAQETLDSLIAMINEVERLGYFKLKKN